MSELGVRGPQMFGHRSRGITKASRGPRLYEAAEARGPLARGLWLAGRYEDGGGMERDRTVITAPQVLTYLLSVLADLELLQSVRPTPVIHAGRGG